MTLRQFTLGLGLVFITLISITLMARSQIFRPEDLPIIRSTPDPEYTKSGHIVYLETGWADDTMTIRLDPSVPFVNPPNGLTLHGCKTETLGYQLDPKDPGIKVHEAALLSAFVAGKNVRLLIWGCFADKPKVIAVGLTN